MKRRRALTVFGTILISGCTTGTDANGDNGEGTNDNGDTEGVNPEERVLIDETIYTEQRIPERLYAGETLHISVDLERGSVCVIDVANATERESIFAETVRTEEEFEIPVEADGEYYITFQGHDRASVRVVAVG